MRTPSTKRSNVPAIVSTTTRTRYQTFATNGITVTVAAPTCVWMFPSWNDTDATALPAAS
jgi:hypothetical protein